MIRALQHPGPDRGPHNSTWRHIFVEASLHLVTSTLLSSSTLVSSLRARRTAVMVVSEYVKQWIVHFHSNGLLSTATHKELLKEGIEVSVVGVWKFLRRYETFSTTARQAGSGRPSIVMLSVKAIIETQMETDGETTVTQLKALLTSKGYSLSLSPSPSQS